jgi:2-keto-4-pentenoate hydratase/2-oxohepta-3-ene-1,7-dioic acid hydratase (catechol pathway)
MRFGRFTAGGRAFHGRLEDDVVLELGGAPWGPHARFRQIHRLADVAFLPPVVPGTFYAAGFNYAGHNARHQALGHGAAPVGERPEVGYRANSALVGHGAPIVKPTGVEGRFEAEAEVVAVIGRELRRASRDEARDAVFGWTIGNDVSAREWQHADRTFYRAKNADTFKPMGPWIQTDVDPLRSTTTVRINGAEVASFGTGDMIFDPYDFLVEMTKYITVHPGDVLWMGAEGATQLEVGDTVDIEISGIGVLSNPVVAEPEQPGDTVTARHHEGASR